MLESTLDVIRDVVSGVRHRVKSPWGSAFIISWLIFNWKPVYYIFSSDESSIAKIDHIEIVYSDVCITVIYPLIWSLIFCITYPFILNTTSLLWLVSQKWSSHLHVKFLNSTTYITRSEGDEYIKQIEELTKKNMDLTIEFEQKERDYTKKIRELQHFIGVAEKVDAAKPISLEPHSDSKESLK